ncbi:unnamed protein product [Linum tenue]|uniref:GDSL esterase/lipase n=1 Tax=Linum tenue TaxID=586396 RepID=A0AAV0I9M0_9ROSI|nr:unnamed protein product [Linum tenue]
MATKCLLSSPFQAVHYFFFCMVVLLLLQCCSSTVIRNTTFRPPAVYVFGDSLFDVGTNNYVKFADVQVKANFPFYGIDFPHSLPTGRFSNGFNLADQIVKKMGFRRSPPPFLSLVAGGKCSPKFNQTIIKGVNFASAGSGIFASTGSKFIVVPLKTQIQQFSTVAKNLTFLLGRTHAAAHLAQSVFLFSVGSNDIFDYEKNVTGGNQQFNVSAKAFLTSMISEYGLHLQDLYISGARKFGIVGVPAVGCCPFLRSFNFTGGCIVGANLLAQAFMEGLTVAAQQIGAVAPDVKYSLANAFNLSSDFIQNTTALKLHGFKDVTGSCCGNATVPCSPNSTVCGNRGDNLFWDGFHPTQFVAKLSADAFFGNDPRYVSPVGFGHLIQN